jgi:toxin HigB-1
MIIRFHNDYLEALYKGEQKGKPRFSDEVVLKFKKTVNLLKNAESSNELKLFRSLNFEQLKSRKNSKCYSVRVDIQYRLIFDLKKDHILLSEIISIKELSKHYQ